MRKDRLGKGLGALLGEYAGGTESKPKLDGDIQRLALNVIVPNPHQPRKEFAEEDLAELVASIKENGLLQPLVVRTSPKQPDRYELIAGERRFRSLQTLGWDEAPVMIREVDDETLLVLAMVENLQREALNPLEEAEGYQTLSDRFNLTQEEIAKAVGKDRSTVANMVRLLRLPPSLRKMVSNGSLSAGHARALLSLSDPVRMAELGRAAANEGWSVRETERRAKSETPNSGGNKKEAGGAPRDPVVRALEQALQERLATRVQIRSARKGKGTIEVPFNGTEEFERLFALITGVEAAEFIN